MDIKHTSYFFLYICPGIASILIGALVSLVRLPPIARLGRHRVTVRIAAIFILAIVSFSITLGLVAQLGAGIEYFLYWRSVGNYARDRLLEVGVKAVFIEMWIRRIIPPLLRHDCYTGNAYTCFIADVVSIEAGIAAISWTWEVVMGLISAMTTTLVRGYMHYRQLIKQSDD